RDYQIATAAFYAMQYEDAGRRFRAIASSAASPWRIYGRYLAARASIRSATMADDGTPEQRARSERLLAQAEADLNATLQDPSGAFVHSWARQMLAYVAARIHPMERLHALSARLSASPDATSHDVDDYRWVMDRLLGDTLAYPYPDPARVAEMAEGDDLTDWILAMQGEGASGDRAVARWQATRSVPWLVAVLWRAPDDHPGAAPAVEAAAAVRCPAPAEPTVS